MSNLDTYKVTTLNSVLDEISPGFQFYVLNGRNPEVAVLIRDQGVITANGWSVSNWRTIRPSTKRYVDRFPIHERFFQQVNLSPLLVKGDELPAGQIVLVVNSDRNYGRITHVVGQELTMAHGRYLLHDHDPVAFGSKSLLNLKYNLYGGEE